MISRSFTVTQDFTLAMWSTHKAASGSELLHITHNETITPQRCRVAPSSTLDTSQTGFSPSGTGRFTSHVCHYQPSSCSRCLLSGVLIRIVRLVSFRPPEAELGSCDPPVHIFNVFTLGLKVVRGVIRTGHKYLGRMQEKAEDNKTKLCLFFFRKHHYLAPLPIIVGYQQVPD